jgi:hypothetical protein
MDPTVGPPHRVCPDGQAGKQPKQVLFAAEQVLPRPVRVYVVVTPGPQHFFEHPTKRFPEPQDTASAGRGRLRPKVAQRAKTRTAKRNRFRVITSPFILKMVRKEAAAGQPPLWYFS